MKKILAFEDNQNLLDEFKNEYQKLGFEFLGLPFPPEDLIALILRFKPDIISMDVTMPYMDGISAAKIIKANPQTAGIPLFFYTNMGRPEDKGRGKALGAAGYFLKTEISPLELVKLVPGLLNS
ncbi:response regulator [Candidatus Parcubacteria bacterium]|jgi:CheY-like chemotaxis protein|nr:MAG: response regulator [Candidatus Parcubacteria bacterium]